MRRFSPIMETLRARLASGVIARPVIYYASDIRQIRPKLAMHDAQQNGGPIIDMAVHLIDTWRYIFQSEAVRVSAQGLTLAQGRPELRQIAAQAPDAAIITATFASGDIGSFVVCWGLPPGVNPPGVPEQIYAPNGLAEISWKMKEQSLRWMAEGGEWVTLVESNDDSYQNEIAVMAACILEDKPFPVTPQDGVDALNVALSALESIQSGKEVYLKNATGFTPDANSLAS